ncbi:hypothetical protein AVEN_60127-1 [Araneus ventricosus]|uniref:Uncharacterized protein n=1 Tax=Araneus ventricosus TaxID=182803 RepID=A0A4Y2GLG5_ARAVE|nr:hypothetical protein AVEN_60127-1 [Araneus ventricosus]
MAANKGNSNTALGSDSLVARAKPEKQKKNRKTIEVLDSVPMGSADDFVVPKKSVLTEGSVTPGTVHVPSVPGMAGRTYRFGQTNPFALPKVGASTSGTGDQGLVTAGTEKQGTGYIGFGLASRLPQGISWGDTPYPGSLAAARVMDGTGVDHLSQTMVAPVMEQSSEAPAGLILLGAQDLGTDSVVPSDRVVEGNVPLEIVSMVPETPMALQGGVLLPGGDGDLPPDQTVIPENPIGGAMEVSTKSGHKRKPDRVRTRTKKVHKSKTESAVDSLSLDNSSSGSDSTVIVSDNQREIALPDAEDTISEDISDTEIPPTPRVPLSVTCGPDSIVPGDKYAEDRFSYKNTGISPWLHKLTLTYMANSDGPENTVSDMKTFLQLISDVFEDMNSRLQKFESLSARLDKLEAAHSKPLFTQVVSTPLFSVGVQGSGPPPIAVVKAKRNRRKPKTGGSSLGLEPAVVPSAIAPLAPNVLAPTGNRVPQTSHQEAPVRVKSRVTLKPRPESPTVLVQPLGNSVDSSKALRSLLEAHIRPQQLGLRVMSCLPAAECGVMVTLQTNDMTTLLETHINGHPELNGVCRARVPRRPHPRILIYDVPSLPGDREEQENCFLEKLRVSNSFPEGGVSVLFRRRGRGSAQHWVLSLDPVVYHCIRNTNRLH